jgi:hypothetical protein
MNLFSWLHLLGDVITHPVFIVGTPVLLVSILYVVIKPKSILPVLSGQALQIGLVYFWWWYKAPMNCPLWMTCTPDATAKAIGYNLFWILAGLPFLVLLFWIAVSQHKQVSREIVRVG